MHEYSEIIFNFVTTFLFLNILIIAVGGFGGIPDSDLPGMVAEQGYEYQPDEYDDRYGPERD